MTNNGQPPFGRPSAAEIPLVGQPFELAVWFVQVVLTCRCERPSAVVILGQPGASGICGQCRRIYTLQAMTIQHGKPNFQIGMAPPLSADPQENSHG